MSPPPSPITVGCCGFRAARAGYFLQLPAVEVQQTFYQPPRPQTLARWKEEAPEGFVFTVKAWQLITHPASSPTYRRLKRALTDDERAGAGSFQDSAAVAEARAVTRACADALDARAVLFQCPPSFGPTAENVARLLGFFEHAERDGRLFCWEPRGGWPRDLVRDLCVTLNLWHVVDPFAEETTTPDRCYYRLHGRGGWRYAYEDGELETSQRCCPPEHSRTSSSTTSGCWTTPSGSRRSSPDPDSTAPVRGAAHLRSLPAKGSDQRAADGGGGGGDASMGHR